MTDWRIASSSTPICSMSSGVRWAIGLWAFFCRTVMGASVSGRSRVGGSVDQVRSSGEAVVSGRSRRRRPRPRCRSGCGSPFAVSPSVGGGDLAVAQVADGARAQREHAAEADAHPAPRGHQHAGLLAGVQDRGAARRRRPRCRTGRTPRCRRRRRRSLGPEALGDQRPGSRASWCCCSASSSPAGPQAQVLRSARSGTSSAQVVHVESAVLVGVPLDQPDQAGRVQLPQVGQEDRVGRGGRDVQHDDVVRLRARSRTAPASDTGNRLRSMPITGVMPQPAVTNRKRPPSVGQHEVAGRLLEVDQSAGPAVADQVVADLAVRHRLDGDADPAVGTGCRGSASRHATDGPRRRRPRSARTGRVRGRPSPRPVGSRSWRRRRSRGARP